MSVKAHRVAVLIVAVLLGGLTVLANPAAAAACDIEGTSGDDVLVGTEAGEIICGFGGNDVIDGTGGDDVLIGGAGSDRLFGGAGDDLVIGGTGIDVLVGGAGSDLHIGDLDGDIVEIAGTAADDSMNRRRRVGHHRWRGRPLLGRW